MYALIIVAALTVSLAALIHLARTDPKRRRVFDLPEYEGKRRVWLSLAILIVPGIALLATGDAAGFTIWLGALTVLGWGVAALDPQRSAKIVTGLRYAAMNTWLGLIGGTHAVRHLYRGFRVAPERIAALERRVGELEAELARRDEADFMKDGRVDTGPTTDSVNGVSTN